MITIIKQKGQPCHAIGIEYDSIAIRAAKVALDGKGGAEIVDLVDVTGDFSEDGELVKGLRQIKDKLKKSSKEKIVVNLGGKQVFVTQLEFRKLPAEEMESALRLEMRKLVPFDVAGASIDFQILDDFEPRAESASYLVAMSAAGALGRFTSLFEKADLPPYIVDVLPVAVMNAVWHWVGEVKSDHPITAIHLGPQTATIVIDGLKYPIFNRSVFFPAEDMVGLGTENSAFEKHLQALSDEVSKSLAYYEKSTTASGFRELHLLGDFLESGVVAKALERRTGLPAKRTDLARRLGANGSLPGKFDLALSLAMRGGDQ